MSATIQMTSCVAVALIAALLMLALRRPSGRSGNAPQQVININALPEQPPAQADGTLGLFALIIAVGVAIALIIGAF